MRTLTNRVRRVSLALGTCLCLLLVIGGIGCKKEGQTPTPVKEPNAVGVAPTSAKPETTTPEAQTPIVEVPKPAPERSPNAAAVTVNGETIPERDVTAIIDQNIKRAGGQMPATYVEQFKQQMRPRVLENLIAQRLLDQQVQAAHIEMTDDEVTSKIEEQLGKVNPPMTLEKYKEMVTSQGGNFGEALEQFKKNLMRERFLDSQWAGKIDVNDQDAQAYYDEHPQEFAKPEQVQASHILIKPDTSDPNTDPNEAKALARTKIDGLQEQIKAGADFAELAKANSDCPSAEKGGDLGSFGREQMVKPFSDAAFAMEPNQVSDVVETRFGYHIIKVTGRTAAEVTPFDEAKAGIVAKLENQKKRQFFETFMKSLQDRAVIVYPETEGAAATTSPVPAVPPVAPPTSAAPADASEN